MSTHPDDHDKVALVVSHTDISSDPRVRREVDWLLSDGYTVDTLGTNSTGTPHVRNQFQLVPKKRRWANTKLWYLLTGTVLPKKLAFKLKALDSIPPQLIKALENREYSLVVINDLQLLPLVSFDRLVGDKCSTHVHLDLHERHRPSLPHNTVGRLIADPLYRWTYRHVGHPRINSRSVVNAQIGNIYSEEFGIDDLVPIRNVPFYQDLSPTAVDPDHIRMVFHGLPSGERGFRQILDALELLPSTFTMDFMITPAPRAHAWLEDQIAKHSAGDRIKIVEPAPMTEIPQWINKYDLEIIYFPETTDNLKFALPNKLFEAVQGRLGVVVAAGGAMDPVVREWGNGVVVPGHDGDLLAAALRDLTAEDIVRFKEASDKVARCVNAEAEGVVFLEALLQGEDSSLTD